MHERECHGRQAGSRVRSKPVDRRTVLRATAGGATGVALAGCLSSYETITGSSSDDEETITIGMLAPEPESNFVGRSMAQAAAVAVDELNENGGIDGKEVELAVGDTNGSPLEARRQYQRLILEEGADVTVGMFASEALVNILDDIAEQETIHLTAGAATQIASRRVHEEYDRYKYHFRVGPTNDVDLGRAQINFMNDIATDIGWESIAVLAEDYPWADEPWRIYQEQLADTPVDVVMDERYPPATNDFSEMYDDVVEAGADAVFISTAHTGTDALLDWSYPNRPDPQPQPQPFAFGGIHVPMQLPTYYEDTNGACRYGLGYSAATEESEITEVTPQFVDRYYDTFGTYPQDMGYYTYDSVALFAEAVERTGTTETDELISELEGIEYTGATGAVEFYDTDHVHAHDRVYDVGDDSTVGIYFQWQETDDGEGVREVIWPETYATSEYVTPPWLADG
ncbi:ABC transporter substrate-binding protein [Natronorubrum texcoconense]|uniref:Amino acid/amide ABC transporter substrate-binding protein, HAAT family n=1 Tax=Natronorubrum texcoconense TaxID=1095776 RepID=A0A1G8SVZ0_9EURY|nr:ABC transporter substrate-binding protein [Natronorubrum texcoconense]SDJ33409.1 amino acid/amide ABC transporter substrate-binding protein, HAAT family [Natronorubrum texcoconense]